MLARSAPRRAARCTRICSVDSVDGLSRQVKVRRRRLRLGRSSRLRRHKAPRPPPCCRWPPPYSPIRQPPGRRRRSGWPTAPGTHCPGSRAARRHEKQAQPEHKPAMSLAHVLDSLLIPMDGLPRSIRHRDAPAAGLEVIWLGKVPREATALAARRRDGPRGLAWPRPCGCGSGRGWWQWPRRIEPGPWRNYPAPAALPLAPRSAGPGPG